LERTVLTETLFFSLNRLIQKALLGSSSHPAQKGSAQA